MQKEGEKVETKPPQEDRIAETEISNHKFCDLQLRW